VTHYDIQPLRRFAIGDGAFGVRPPASRSGRAEKDTYD
jgi:hypothetical protein